MGLIALGIGLLLLGLIGTMVVCSRMNDLVAPRGALDTRPRSRRADDQSDAVEVFEV